MWVWHVRVEIKKMLSPERAHEIHLLDEALIEESQSIGLVYQRFHVSDKQSFEVINAIPVNGVMRDRIRHRFA